MSERYATTVSALSSFSCPCVVATAITRMPPACAASTPAGASSTTMHPSGTTPNRSDASRYASGSGLPRSTSSAVTRTVGMGNPVCLNRVIATSLVPDVATAHEPLGSERTSLAAPSILTRPSVSTASSASKRTASTSALRCGATRRMVSTVRLPCATRIISAASRLCCIAQRRQCRSMTAIESMRTPSRSNITASHRSCFTSLCVISQLLHCYVVPEWLPGKNCGRYSRLASNISSSSARATSKDGTSGLTSMAINAAWREPVTPASTVQDSQALAI